MFGRKKTLNDELAPTTTDESARPGAKNRPTPKRREQEALNKRPLIVTDRKAAGAQDKAARREAMAKQRAGMMTGDEKYLPVRDKGPRRRFIRDTVDARWNIGEFMLPIMLIVLLLSFVRTNWALLLVFVLVYGLILVAIVDALLMWRRTRRKVEDKFGGGREGRRVVRHHARLPDAPHPHAEAAGRPRRAPGLSHTPARSRGLPRPSVLQLGERRAAPASRHTSRSRACRRTPSAARTTSRSSPALAARDGPEAVRAFGGIPRLDSGSSSASRDHSAPSADEERDRRPLATTTGRAARSRPGCGGLGRPRGG